MNRLVIKTVFPPKRCEVCHKDDRFDAASNYCSRCSGIAEANFTAPPKFESYQRPQRQPRELIVGLWFGAAGFVPFLLISSFVLLSSSGIPNSSDAFLFFLSSGLLPALIAGLFGYMSGSSILYRTEIRNYKQAMMRGAGIAFKSLIIFSVLLSFIFMLMYGPRTNFFGMLVGLLIGAVIVAGLPVSIIGAAAGSLLFKFFQPRDLE